MRASNNNLTILSEAEKAALYEIPDFDDVQRSNYLNFTPEEQVLMRSRDNLSAQVHCAIQIGYFKAKHRFFSFNWDEVQEDIDFIMQEYFPGQQVSSNHYQQTPILCTMQCDYGTFWLSVLVKKI